MVEAGVVGIVANLLLTAFKIAVGLLSNSIAIVVDAVNNLSDALSSIVTIIGTKLAGRQADREHPYGHGRMEYMTTIVISVMIVAAGFLALREAVGRILNPEPVNYEAVTLVVVAVATVVKIFLGRYTKKKGRLTNSDTLVASGKDALLDAVISASTLVAAVIYLGWGIGLEAWLGAAIALVILKAGIDILREASSKILGQRVDSDISRAVKNTVCEFPEVNGAYDLALLDFGPDRLHGSVNIEVDDSMTADKVANLSRRIQGEVLRRHGVVLKSVGIYSTNTGDPEAWAMRTEIERIIWDHAHVMGVHGFYVNKETHEVDFDIVMAYEAADRHAEFMHICNDVQEAYLDWTFSIALDDDMSD